MLACGSAALALLIVGGGPAWRHIDTRCDAKGRQLLDQAEAVALRIAPQLALQNLASVQQLLSVCETDATVEAACLYGTDRQVLATWGEQGLFTAPTPTAQGYRYVGWSRVEATCGVVLGAQRLGTLRVIANTSDLTEQLVAFAKSAGTMVAMAMLVVLLFAVLLQNTIARPLLELTKAATQASHNADLTNRIGCRTAGEARALQEAFNRILDRLQSSESSLHQAHRKLEDVVIARAKDLSREVRRHEEAEVELATAHRVAAAANRAKSEFLANLGHESTHPLDEILRLTTAVLHDWPTLSPEDRHEYLSTVHRHGTRLTELMKDIQVVATSEVGPSEPERVACSRHQAFAGERTSGLPQPSRT